MDRFISVVFVIFSLIAPFSNGCPTIVSRKQWEAKPPVSEKAMDEPVPYVVIHHTYIPKVCNTTKECMAAMRSMQRFHQNDRKWSDIGYNFCIGGDGQVYEGRGWGTTGAHAPKYNTKSIGICLIGDYVHAPPHKKMIHVTKELIKCGIQKGHIEKDHVVIGHRQATNTQCPGDALYKIIQTWPHWKNQTGINWR